MPPKLTSAKSDNKKNIIVTPSRLISRPDRLEGGEETEITAQVSVPQEGGWGWVVVTASFICIFILDGVCYTFGSFLKDMSDDLNVADSLVALINSIAVSIYFIAGPLASAFINRFGFRVCVMSGAVTCAFSLFASYFASDFSILCIFYGVIAGFGYCMINLACTLVVGFYFEKLRPIAISLATCGSSFGVMTMFPINTYLITLSGWRNTTLFHSGLFSLIYFLGMTFRPLLSLTVVKSKDDPTRTVTFLPNLSATAHRLASSSIKSENLVPTTTERLFSAVSNYNFPTAAAVVEDGATTTFSQPGPSSVPKSKLTLMARGPTSGISRRQLKQIQSVLSKSNVDEKVKKNLDIPDSSDQSKKRSFWARLFHWEEHVPESRPLYRDDAFYDGRLEKLPIYQKSMMETEKEIKTGLEYQLAVSRAATTVDLQEKRGVFTTAARRVLATMMDPKLLKQKSFLLLSASAFLIYVGFLVPYVYIQNRNLNAGIDQSHCILFVSVIGFANAIGRFVLGVIACKYDPLYIFSGTCIIAGISTILSDITYNLYYQFSYCFVFGFCVAGTVCLRSMVLVNLYGLDKLTNATGMILLFHGLGSLISTPLAGVLKNKFEYSVAFHVAGIFITLGGLLLLRVKNTSSPTTIVENQNNPSI